MLAAIPLFALAALTVGAAPSRRGTCASGYTYGSTTTTMTINAPMTTMESITKSFFDATWEGINGGISSMEAVILY